MHVHPHRFKWKAQVVRTGAGTIQIFNVAADTGGPQGIFALGANDDGSLSLMEVSGTFCTANFSVMILFGLI